MNLSQIIEALPFQVYVRRGELVIHFSTPADLIGRLADHSSQLIGILSSACTAVVIVPLVLGLRAVFSSSGGGQ